MNHKTRIDKAILSLEGLSIGDSFGQEFFIEQDKARELINLRHDERVPLRLAPTRGRSSITSKTLVLYR